MTGPEPYALDLRANDDPSLAIVPRVENWADAHAAFGLRHLAAYGADAAPAGALYWKLVGVYIRTGVAAYIPQVQDEDGTPYWHIPTNTGALLVRTWPGVEEIPIPDPLRPDYNTLIGPAYAPHHGVLGWTNANGDAGFPYGAGSVAGPGGGPDAIWVHAAPEGSGGPQFSDCLAGLGWAGGTDHCTPNPIFQLTRQGGDVPPPASSGDYLLIYHNGAVIMHIPLREGAPPAGFCGLALSSDGALLWHVAGLAGGPP